MFMNIIAGIIPKTVTKRGQVLTKIVTMIDVSDDLDWDIESSIMK